MWSRTLQSTLPEWEHFICGNMTEPVESSDQNITCAWTLDKNVQCDSKTMARIISKLYSLCVWESNSQKASSENIVQCNAVPPTLTLCMACCAYEWEFLHYFSFTMILHTGCGSLLVWCCSEMLDLTLTHICAIPKPLSEQCHTATVVTMKNGKGFLYNTRLAAWH